MKYTLETKFELAKKAFDNSYSKYSKFKVGALLILKNGDYFLGTNVENASFGLTNCAERTALFAAHAYGFKKEDFVELVVLADSPKTTYPCGACRQVIMELMPKGAVITLMNLQKEVVTLKVEDLMIGYFGEEYLNV